jgi:Protein of unknown function (DUF3047)
MIILVAQITGCMNMNATSVVSTSDELPALLLTPNQTPPADSDSPAEINPAWTDFILLPHKKRTKYSTEQLAGVRALRADAIGSATGLQANVSIDPAKKRYISFSWRADEFADDADVANRDLEDAPVRVIVAFEGDITTLDARDRALSDQAKFFTGRPLPYATLMYVWSNSQKLEDIVTNPHSRRVKKVVISNKSTEKKKWHHFKRDLVKDYERAFGKKPGKIKAVAIMTDSDNTGDRALAYYKNLRITAE